MDVDRIGAGRREVGDVTLGPVDHEVYVEPAAGGVDRVAQRLHDQRPDRDRRDEVPVHDIDVDDAGAGIHDRGHLVAEASEVGREYRRSDAAPARQLRRHRGWSIEWPQ